ncbi:MAG: hypothetical protein ACLSA6_03195 [Holdemania massiliensis]
MKFNSAFDLLEEDLRQAIEALHYTQPTPVQQQVIPAFWKERIAWFRPRLIRKNRGLCPARLPALSF